MCLRQQPMMRQEPAPVRPAPDQSRSSVVNAARLKALAARGVKANIFTSALGDAGYGQSTTRATALGQVGAAA